MFIQSLFYLAFPINEILNFLKITFSDLNVKNMINYVKYLLSS